MKMRESLPLLLLAVSLIFSSGSFRANDESSPGLFDGPGPLPCSQTVPPSC